MKAIFLLTALIMIGAPSLALPAHAVSSSCLTIPYPNDTCPVHQSDSQIRQQDINTASSAAHLPTIHCWDGTSIDPVNGTYVAHCSPAPVCPHGTSPYPDATGMNQTDIEVSKILSDYWQQNYPNGTTVPPA